MTAIFSTPTPSLSWAQTGLTGSSCWRCRGLPVSLPAITHGPAVKLVDFADAVSNGFLIQGLTHRR